MEEILKMINEKSKLLKFLKWIALVLGIVVMLLLVWALIKNIGLL